MLVLHTPPFLLISLDMGSDIWVRSLGPIAPQGVAWMHFANIAEALRYLRLEDGGSLHIQHTQVAQAAKWGAAKEGWPRNPPPCLGFFYSYTLQRHPKALNTNAAPSMRLLWGTLGPGLAMPNFGVFLETPFWARTPLGTPLHGQEGGFLGGFLGRNSPLPRPLPGHEPPFLHPSYDPSRPEAIAHKSVRSGLNRIVPPH